MKKVSPLFAVAVGIIILFALPWIALFAIDQIAQSEIETKTILQSNSPDEEYSICIDGRMGTGLLNVPVYITVYGDAIKTNERCCTVSTHIDNNNGGAGANKNVWTIWEEPHTAVIILLGKEQFPELIEIVFGETGETTTVTRKQDPETYGDVRKLFEEFEMDIDAIPSHYWNESKDRGRHGDGS